MYHFGIFLAEKYETTKRWIKPVNDKIYCEEKLISRYIKIVKIFETDMLGEVPREESPLHGVKCSESKLNTFRPLGAQTW